MSLFWPARSKAETTVLVRLGRVLHWVSVLMAVAIILLGPFARGQRAPCYPHGQWDICPPPPSWFEEWGAPILFAFAVGAVVVLIGRALRYILAGE
jgi:hypothetical protein